MESADATEYFDGVVVVGAGPVGMTAALVLEQQGVPVLVLEAGDTLSTQSRASTFHAPTLDMLQEVGVAQELVSRGLVADTYQLRDRDGVIVELEYSVLQDDTGFPFRLQCEQRQLTDIALGVLRSRGVEVRFGYHAESASNLGDEVVVEFAGAKRPIRSQWAIGADGAHSVLRRSMGVAFEGRTYPERYLVITTSFPFETVIPDLCYVNYIIDPVQWYALLKNPAGWRPLFPVPLDADDDEVTSPANIKEHLERLAPKYEVPVEHVTLYRIHRRVADRFRDGRVLLVGDAAHVNNPLGGMGMNSGIHDAYFAGKALGDLWHGRRETSALDEWADRRRRVAVEYVGADTDRNWKNIRETDKRARERQYREWKQAASSRAEMRKFLLRTSMLESLRHG